MTNSKVDNESKDKRDFSRKKYSGKKSKFSLMHSAVCDECGKDCQVPFKPTMGKPIYCNECFEKKNRRSNNRFDRRDFHKHNFRDRGPSRFGDNKINNQSINLLLEKVETLNNKLNTVIGLLTETGKNKTKSKKEKKNKKLKAQK